MGSTRPIEDFSSGQIPKYSVRPISRMTNTYSYKPKNKKSYKKNKKITNSSKNKTAQRFSVSATEAGITSSMDNEMKFHLNMTYGSEAAYEKNTSKYFDRLYSVYVDKEITNLCQYIFMVRPSLNILNKKGTALQSYSSNEVKTGYYPNSSAQTDQFFNYMFKTYPYILKSLTPSLAETHDFIPFLVGRAESLQIPDFTIKSYKMQQPYTNYNLPYASHGLESLTGGQFEISFRDDDEFRIHKMFQSWVYYINGVTRNIFGPDMYNIRHNKIDYATSVYCITCKPDAETIIYWSKYTGAFPTSVPNSDLSFNLRGNANNKLTIPFDYLRQESLDPLILVDFNKNAHVIKDPDKEPYIPVYRSGTISSIGMADPRLSSQKKIHNNMNDAKVNFSKKYPISLGSGNGLVGCPFICKDANTNEYKLRWKKISNLSKT